MKKGTALGVLAAMVGAGIASGREIMHFYSRFGPFSWLLVLFSGALLGLLTRRVMDTGDGEAALLPQGPWLLPGKCLLAALYLAVGGGMTAAAGELMALTLPVGNARLLGGAVTLGLCAFLAKKTLAALNCLGGALLLGMTALFLACLGVPKEPQALSGPTAGAAVLGAAEAACSCGMNVLLASAVIREGGKGSTAREKNRIAAETGLLTGGLLTIGNAALLPHAALLSDAALPTVLLLRAYGKTGYYGAAALLYLAVATTLIAVLRGFFALFSPGRASFRVPLALLGAGAASLLGFQGVVASAYPVLGLLCLLLLLKPGQ